MRKVLALAVVATLGGCMAPRIDAGRHAVDYNRAVEIEANETVLLNIIRSKYRTSTHYTSTTGITAKLKAEHSAAATIGYDDSAFTESLDANRNVLSAERVRDSFSGSAGYSLTYGQEPTFSIAVHNTPDFARGTLSAISKDDFYRFIGDGYRTSLMIELLVESMTISDPVTGASLSLDNPAGREGNTCDAELFREVRDTLRISPRVETAKAPEVARFKPTLDNLVKAEKLLEKGFSLGDGRADDNQITLMGKKPEPKIKPDSNLAGLPALVPSLRPCLGSAAPGKTEAKAARLAAASAPADLAVAGGLKVAFNLRSVDGVVYAMGEYLRAMQKNECGSNERWLRSALDGKAIAMNQGSSCHPTYIGAGKGETGDELFVLIEQDGRSRPVQALTYTKYMGKTWWVPEGDWHRTMQVVNVIQKLLNLNKSASEIRTPTFILD